MILTKIEVSDFLSIRGTLPIDLDKKITIFLGSNDHGKSNILRAIQHLNDEDPILATEANWDAEDSEHWDPAKSPSISYIFALSPSERKEWKAAVEQVVQDTADRAAEALLETRGVKKIQPTRISICLTSLECCFTRKASAIYFKCSNNSRRKIK